MIVDPPKNTLGPTRLTFDIPLSSVPHFPDEDSKLRATGLRVRRGGNCPNTIEVFQQLLGDEKSPVRVHLVSPLPERESQATARIIASLTEGTTTARAVSFDHCLFREGHREPASSYVLRSETTGSRTIVNHNDLPEMTTEEFLRIAEAFRGQAQTWWHFEGRVPDTTLECIRILRRVLGEVTVSVEVEKPGRPGLRELAAEADVVFYSRSWAEVGILLLTRDRLEMLTTSPQDCGYTSAEACLRNESLPRASVGAGDTFVAGMLYGLICQADRWDIGVQQVKR
ncbi:Ketohexokinase [Colletotrichum chlorophyti]|uniref:Ketohexokinase n=1 Tax=Colletotrichum chlorophyti TaxID=708187 RepID=A0A1Q8RJJ0_9PEZI|nr:Ketohexokinase [Colletotrichum chlorophyti]